ncbi:MAG: DUF4382 domain-containing protein [Candidatus Riflebacteria bacterium]|nr:DUF4382 domain-containing protein [Candidatus Riflebacteria bacterium]
MMNTSKNAVLLATLAVLPFLVGCFGTVGGSNPMAAAPTALEDGVVMAESEAAELLACKVLGKTSTNSSGSSSKRFSYAQPPHSIVHAVSKKFAHLCGALKVRFTGSNAENIFLTLEDMKIRGSTGRAWSVPLPPTEIDLKAASTLSQLLADLELPSGTYTYLEFKVKTARVVFSGKSYPLKVPSNRIRFLGKFSIQDGYDTVLTIKFFHKLLEVRGWRWHEKTYVLTPIVRISSTLVPRVAAVTTGDLSGSVLDYVKKTPLAGVQVVLGQKTATTGADGTFSFTELATGTHSLSLTHPDYLDKSFEVEVVAGQEATVVAEMNPAVITSSVANTGWFSLRYPLADAQGQYGEVALETPVSIDFVSLAFTKVTLAFDSDYHSAGAGRFNTYLSSSQQVQIITNLGGWWVGNNALLGSLLGEFYATNPTPSHYEVDVTEYVRSNPSTMYYMAARNLAVADIRLSNIQMTINYR